MAHGKVRDEKTCLNCGAPVPGRFCSNCGQENIEPKQTVWHLVNHFFSDVTHFDGKFFTTVKDLFKKPGFLSSEYVKGKRVSYLDPIRMYIFTSAVFFLIFFSIINLHELENGRLFDGKEKFAKARETSLAAAGSHEDSVAINAAFDALGKKAGKNTDHSFFGEAGRRSIEKTDSANRAGDSIERADDSVEAAKDRQEERAGKAADSGKASFRYKPQKQDTGVAVKEDKPEKQKAGNGEKAAAKEEKADRGSEKKIDHDADEALNFSFDDNDKKYKTQEAYDSAQAALPANRRDRWLKRTIARKIIEINEKWHEDQEGLWREWAATFIHNFPKIMFISLPLFALLLKLLYVRRKQFYYVDHGIFSVHLYIFSFLVLLVWFGMYSLHAQTHWRIFRWLEFILFFYPFWYYYKAMRNFYCQSRAKTFVKYVTLLFLSFIFQLMLFMCFLLFSIVQT